MDLTTLPFFERLAASRTVLLAGAGGGFDVFAGLPIYFALLGKGVKVHLANLSFSRLDGVDGRRVAPTVVEIGPDSVGPSGYFPEIPFEGRTEHAVLSALRTASSRSNSEDRGAPLLAA